MTGYAHRSGDTPLGRVTIELRSVNSRFTDLVFRLGDEVRTIEPKLREQITAAVSRGKIECRIQARRPDDAQGNGIQINEALIASLASADAQIRGLVPDAAPLAVADYLRWQMASNDAAGAAGRSGPGAGAAEAGAADEAGADGDFPAERLWPVLQPMVEQVLAEFVASREREGARLAATIVRQVEEMKVVVARLEPMIPELLAGARARLTARLQEAMPDAAAQAAPGIAPEETFARIRQEIALLSLRGDVTEEFNRLTIHFEEILRALDQGGPIGKRLDFLTQELNRESNTLASKASGVAVTDGAVALKLLVEQMREQVQNLE